MHKSELNLDQHIYFLLHDHETKINQPAFCTELPIALPRQMDRLLTWLVVNRSTRDKLKMTSSGSATNAASPNYVLLPNTANHQHVFKLEVYPTDELKKKRSARKISARKLRSACQRWFDEERERAHTCSEARTAQLRVVCPKKWRFCLRMRTWSLTVSFRRGSISEWDGVRKTCRQWWSE